MPTATEHAEEVLQRLRKRRTTSACYPCFKRKVRCEGGRPCQACVQRNHPEICHDENGPRSHKKARSKQNVATPRQEPAADGSDSLRTSAVQSTSPESQAWRAPSERNVSLTASNIESRVGKFSAINFLRNRLSATPQKTRDDLQAGIGIGNANVQIPSVAPLGPAGQNADQAPERQEVLKYFRCFHDSVMTIYPVAPDPVALESVVYDTLTTGQELLDPRQIAVVLACLALGAQFSENVAGSRDEISRDLINRSHAYLQRVNYVFQPSVEVVQALLMIGIALQNLGQSDAAWALLGLNYRLAQSLELQVCAPVDDVSKSPALLWKAIIWQDCLLSLRYDRVPLSHESNDMPDQTRPGQKDLSYFEAMEKVCNVGIDMLRPPQWRRSDTEEITTRLQTLEDIISRGCEHLRSHSGTRTRQQRFEYFALRLHSSLLRAELCRPGFPSTESEADQRRWSIRAQGISSLVTAVEAYLELCKFSNVPLRLWSMTQAAISCALVLALLDSQRASEAPPGLLQRLVEALRIGLAPIELAEGNLQGLCLMRAKAAGLLQSLLADEHIVAPQPARQCFVPQVDEDVLTNTPVPTGFDEATFNEAVGWPTDFSLFGPAFADSVLDFDMGQQWPGTASGQESSIVHATIGYKGSDL